jgi:hypothetical protein
LTQGFAECFRVLQNGGTLIFKWNEAQIPVSKILELTNIQPLLGFKRVNKTAASHFILFVKP